MVRYLSITTHNIMVVSEYEYADLVTKSSVVVLFVLS